MGTSSRHPGSTDRSPLVPPHADAEPGKPLPKPQPRRFQQFRRNLGEFAKTGNRDDLKRGLRSYAHTATGGPTIGPRRFGSAIAVGGALISALSAIAEGSNEFQEQEDKPETGADKTSFSDAIGAPLDVAIQILAESLSPEGQDNDKIREALVCALSESLQDQEDDDFDPSLLDEEIYIDTIVHYLAEVVFIDIYNESGEAFDKAQSEEVRAEREDSIRELISAAVDKHLSTHLQDEITNLSPNDIEAIQLAVLKDVFSEWDGFE